VREKKDTILQVEQSEFWVSEGKQAAGTENKPMLSAQPRRPLTPLSLQRQRNFPRDNAISLFTRMKFVGPRFPFVIALPPHKMNTHHKKLSRAVPFAIVQSSVAPPLDATHASHAPEFVN
jgi:hypothetical protein